MKIYLYLYDSKNKVENPILNDIIKNHTNNYANDIKRRISESNYHFASKVLDSFGGDINTIRFVNNKPIVDDFYMSFSTSNDYFGFTISKLNNGFDLENIIDEQRRDRIAKRILKNELYDNYNNSDNKGYYLTKIWTEFESAAKMEGNGLDYKFNHLDIIYKSIMIDNTIFTVCSKEEFELEVYLNGILRS